MSELGVGTILAAVVEGLEDIVEFVSWEPDALADTLLAASTA